MGGRRKQEKTTPKIVFDSELTGRFAIAHRGREAGRMFLIVGGTGTADRVYIADGRKRRLAYPKLKSKSHLSVFECCDAAARLLPAGEYTDGDIRRAIRGRIQTTEVPKGESNAEG